MSTPASLGRRLAAEGLGTALLVATVVGSGIMAERLAGGNAALALLCNTLPTGAMLVVLILVLGPISGAHLNPAVTMVFALRGALAGAAAVGYIIAQGVGGGIGTLLAHGMFDFDLFQVGSTARATHGLWLSEGIATFGLVVTMLGASRARPDAVPFAVGLYIIAAYWFTASTSFANPAVTLARALTGTFSGIDPAHAPAFIIAQLLGAGAAAALSSWLLADAGPDPTTPG